MKINLTKDQSYDTQTLHDALPEGYSVSGHGEKSVTVHGDITPAIQIIIDTHINEFTQEQRKQKIEDAEFNAKIDAQLADIDAQSIRSLREYIAAKPDAPQFIKDHETNAATLRATRKP